jgi:hypothetical protein
MLLQLNRPYSTLEEFRIRRGGHSGVRRAQPNNKLATAIHELNLRCLWTSYYAIRCSSMDKNIRESKAATIITERNKAQVIHNCLANIDGRFSFMAADSLVILGSILSYSVPWISPTLVTEYYSRMADNFVDHVVSATNLANNLVMVEIESIQQLTDSSRDYCRHLLSVPIAKNGIRTK